MFAATAKDMKYELVCPCLLGVEGLVAEDLRENGLENVRAENGRVLFSGTEEDIVRANLTCRYGERILILLGSFPAFSFEELFQGVKSIPWEDYIGIRDAFPVKGRSLSSKLASVPSCQSIIKKAVVERLREKYGTGWFEESGAVYQIQFLIMKDKVSIMLDTSGQALHKRGYRKHSTEAPIRETLAAAMAKLSRVRSDANFIDPFCGSGTVLIESALYAFRIAPGIKRKFAAESWKQISPRIWEIQRERVHDEIRRDATFFGRGYDLDPAAVELATENARKAGIAKKVKIEQRDIKDFVLDGQYGCVTCNPPYGERLLDVRQAREIYQTMGKVFERTRGWNYTVISPDEEFEKYFGRMADRKRKLYNGMIKCQVYQFYK